MYTERQLKEIAFCLLYKQHFNHGTDGHNSRLTIADLAEKYFRVIFEYDDDLDETVIALYDITTMERVLQL